MSTPEGSSGCRITVDPSTADVLRIEAKKVLMFNHEPFEDFLDYVPAKQLVLADVYRDATAVIDLLDTNLDLLTEIGADNHAIVMAEIHHNRHGVEALNRVFDAYSDTIT